MTNNLSFLTHLLAAQQPIMQFYEQGDFLRIVCLGREDRYIEKKTAQSILSDIAKNSTLFPENEIYAP